MPKISSYTVEKKLSIIKWHKDNGNNMHKTSRKFAIDRKRIREWLKNEQTLISNNYSSKKFVRKLASGRAVLSEELDDALLEFFNAERTDGLAVSNRMLACKALKIANSLEISDFKASDRYIQGWKKRFNISMRRGTNDCQKLPSNHVEAITAFFNAVKFLREQHDYTPFNIINMDETMVRFDEPHARTNEIRGESTIRITNTGCKKRRFTVALAAHASGHKLPAFLIFKEPTGKIPPKVFAALKIPKNIRITCSTSGWMTGERFKEWISRILQISEDEKRRLLILDQAPAHKTCTEDIAKLADTDLVFIPPGCTSIMQPADVVWIKPFKDALRREWSDYISKRQKTAQGNYKRPSRQDMINFVSNAWECVSSNLIEKSFKSCGLSNALDGSENGMFNEHLAAVDSAAIRNDELEELKNEKQELVFTNSDSEDSIDGFSDED